MNPIANLIQLRNAFDERATKAMEIINSLTDVNVAVPNDFTWTLSNGDYVTYTKTLDEMAYYSSDGTWMGFTKVKVYLMTNPDMLTLPVFSGSTKCFNDVISEISDEMNFSSAMANITQQFCTRGKIDVNEIRDIISEAVSYGNDEITRLSVSLRAMADENGKISTLAFLKFVQSMASLSKETIDDDSTWELDTTSPFAFRSFIATLIPSIVTVVGTILLTIGNAITTIIGLVAIGASMLWNALSSNISSSLTVDPDVGTDYVKGPTLYTATAPTLEGFSNIVLNHQLTMHQTICGDVYAWDNEAGDSNKASVNCFLRPIFDPDLIGPIIKYSCRDISSQGTNYTWEKIDQPDKTILRSCIMGEELWTEVMTDPVKVAKSLILDQAIRDFLCMSIGSKFEDMYGNPMWGFQYDTSRLLSAMTLVSYSMNDALTWSVIPSDISKVQQIYTGVYSTFATNALDNQKLVYFFGPNNVVDNATTYAPGTLSYYEGTVLKNPFSLCFTLTGTNDLNCGVVTGLSQIGCFSSTNTDFIPLARAITIPDFTPAEVIRAVAITAVIATAAAIVIGRISRRISAWKAMRQTSRLADLNTARKAYLDDPGDATKAAAFKAAILSYNRRARWFGWGTYDAANGWMNASSSSVAAILSTSDTSSIMERIKSGNTSTDGDIAALSTKLDNNTNTITNKLTTMDNTSTIRYNTINNKVDTSNNKADLVIELIQ